MKKMTSESPEAVHTHTHTNNLNDKNINNKKDRSIILVNYTG